MADIDELRKLPPEERLARLKKLEEEHRREIEEAEELMSESRREITEGERRRDLPSDAVTADTVDQLFTEEEKKLFETKRFETRPQDREESEEQRQPEELEEIAETAPKEEERGVDYGAAIEQSREGPGSAYLGKKEENISDMYGSNEEESMYERNKEQADREEAMKQEHEQHYAP